MAFFDEFSNPALLKMAELNEHVFFYNGPYGQCVFFLYIFFVMDNVCSSSIYSLIHVKSLGEKTEGAALADRKWVFPGSADTMAIFIER